MSLVGQRAFGAECCKSFSGPFPVWAGAGYHDTLDSWRTSRVYAHGEPNAVCACCMTGVTSVGHGG